MKLKELFCDISNMCPTAWEALAKTALLALVTALCALAITIGGQAHDGLTPQMLHIVYGLAETPAGLFAIASVGVILLQREHG
ncbi:MAG: hypothetical protein AB7D36_09305 [Oscillospiraceae bacterium]